MDEIINYVNNSPENTNPNVLRGMLNNMDSSQQSSGGSSGGGIFFVTVTGGWDNDEFAGTSDKSVSEIISAWAAGNLPVLGVVSEGTLDPGPYFVYLYGGDEPVILGFKSLSGVYMEIGGADGKTVVGGYES